MRSGKRTIAVFFQVSVILILFTLFFIVGCKQETDQPLTSLATNNAADLPNVAQDSTASSNAVRDTDDLGPTSVAPEAKTAQIEHLFQLTASIQNTVTDQSAKDALRVWTEEMETRSKTLQVAEISTELQVLLQNVIKPASAEEAVILWANGIKLRNGYLQYAAMSPALKAENLPAFRESLWVTGVSSPWVQDYVITNKIKNEYEVLFALASSTGFAGTENYDLKVEESGGCFYVCQISIPTYVLEK